MELNLLKWLFIFLTLSIVVMGSLVNWLEDHIPSYLPQTFRYGKFAYDGKPSKLKVVEVPKSWFRHFYLFSSLYSLYGLYLVIDVYMYNAKPPHYVTLTLDLLAGHTRNTLTNKTSVLIAMLLMTLQSIRRFYETWFISVFSDGKMNISQYFIGFAHYWGTITIILAEAVGFKFGSSIDSTASPGYSVEFWHVAGVLIFFYAWINQLICAVTLASLRKNSKGKVVSTQHKVAKGGLFEYLSSPHLTCEVLIYLSLLLVLQENSMFPYVFLWVLTNQLETSLLNHWWYQKTFKDYPKQRKAFVPFLL